MPSVPPDVVTAAGAKNRAKAAVAGVTLRNILLTAGVVGAIGKV